MSNPQKILPPPFRPSSKAALLKCTNVHCLVKLTALQLVCHVQDVLLAFLLKNMNTSHILYLSLNRLFCETWLAVEQVVAEHRSFFGSGLFEHREASCILNRWITSLPLWGHSNRNYLIHLPHVSLSCKNTPHNIIMNSTHSCQASMLVLGNLLTILVRQARFHNISTQPCGRDQSCTRKAQLWLACRLSGR